MLARHALLRRPDRARAALQGHAEDAEFRASVAAAAGRGDEAVKWLVAKEVCKILVGYLEIEDYRIIVKHSDCVAWHEYAEKGGGRERKRERTRELSVL